jgi:hypothetical protein
MELMVPLVPLAHKALLAHKGPPVLLVLLVLPVLMDLLVLLVLLDLLVLPEALGPMAVAVH